MSSFLKNKVALVTGASSGIGRATALAFAREGARVVVTDTDQKGGEKTTKLIQDQNGEALFVSCNVANALEVKSMIAQTVETFGRIDLAFNNAGIEGAQALTADSSEENFDKVIAVNLKGVWACMKYEIEAMLKSGGGVIVNCSSIAGLIGFQGIPAYTASKHGVIGLTKTAALEYATRGIRINAVCPGAIMTPMLIRFAKSEAQARELFAKSEPMGRVGEPNEIADVVLWLCSDQSSFVTGQAIPVDGGWVAQ